MDLEIVNMKIYAIEKDLEDLESVSEEDLPEHIKEYNEWKRYVTEYKPEMIPQKEYQGRTMEEYMEWHNKATDYCKDHFGQEEISKILKLFRKLTPIVQISKQLSIPTVYIRFLLKMNMPIKEYQDIKKQIASENARKYRSNTDSMPPMVEDKKLPLLVWQAIYVQKKSFEQTAKDLSITYERLHRIVDSIKNSLSNKASKF